MKKTKARRQPTGELQTLAGGRRQDRGEKGKDKAEQQPKRRLAVYVEADLFRRLQIHKAETDRSLSDLVSDAVERFLADSK